MVGWLGLQFWMVCVLIGVKLRSEKFGGCEAAGVG